MNKPPTAANQYEELLTCAQHNWRRALDDPDADERSHAMAHACSYFSTAWLLHAFMKADTAAADLAMGELHDILCDGGAAGEQIWQMLASLGVDPDSITSSASESMPPSHGYTSHGWPCCDQATGKQPGVRARCGTVGICSECNDEADAIHGLLPAPVEEETAVIPPGPVNDAISAFLDDPSTGSYRERPNREATS